MRDTHTVHELTEVIARLGMGVHIASAGDLPAEIELTRNTAKQRYSVTWVNKQNVGQLPPASAPNSDARPLIVGDHIGPRYGDQLRNLGFDYIDLDGNAFISFGDVLVDVRGRPRRRVGRVERQTSENLFSARRSRVIFVLATWPVLLQRPLAQIAQAAGVSVGLAHSTIQLMQRSGFVTQDRQFEPGRFEQLVDLWVAAYPTGLSRKLEVAAFYGEVDWKRLTRSNPELLRGGVSAVPELIRTGDAVIYTEEFDVTTAVNHRWRTDGEKNIDVRWKFWLSPDPEMDPTRYLSNVPPLLVYADLMASSDPRVHEVARVYKESNAGFWQVL